MDGTVPAILAELALWLAIPRAWNRKVVALLSPVCSEILFPMSLMKLRAMGAQDPMVSVATGMTRYQDSDNCW